MVMADLSKIKVPKIEPVDLSKLPVRLPKIDIDYSKCTVPMWCKKCLEACSQLVFSVYCKQMARLKESDPREPGVYEVSAVRRDKCTMCNKCVEICPEGAITISYNDTVLKGTKTTDTAEEAKKSSYPLFVAPRPYSFELNEEMITLLRQEFEPPGVVEKFAQAIAGKKGTEVDDIAKDVFGEYGEEWMRKVLQLGEEYPDRTHEVLREVIDRTGELFFPLIPQRFIEIAYLSTQQFLKLSVLENYRHKLVYRVPDCYTLRLLREKCSSEVADLLPCKHGCLTALEVLFQDLNLDVTIDMDASEEGYCQFVVTSV
jgi:ferredoxin